MRTFKLFFILSLFIVLLSVSCEDVFEKDISEKRIHLIAPSDSSVTTINDQTFMWTEVEGATGYNLQIVYPSYNRIQKIVLDTNLTNTRFDYTLFSGDFQWSVIAYNNSSSTREGYYQVFNLTVTDGIDFSKLKVYLLYPNENGFCTNTSSILFRWKPVQYADSYLYELRQDNWDTGTTIYSEETTDDSVRVGNFKDGNYYWGVKALHDSSGTETPFSYYKLVIDRIAPKAATLKFPVADTILSAKNIEFIWSRPVDTGSFIIDTIYISSVLGSQIGSFGTSDSTYQHEFTDDGKYNWYVISYDKAGNSSPQSNIGLFEIKN